MRFRTPGRATTGVLCLLVLVLTESCAAIKWLALAKSKQRYWNKTVHCIRSRADGLVSRQVKICKQNLELMSVLWHASHETMDICEELYKDRRWNCSSVRSAPNFPPDLTGGAREQAYIYSLSSAAVAQSMAKACSRGATRKCACGRLPNEPPPGAFKWGGCGDDLQFGLIFSKVFSDAPWASRKKPKTSKRALMNLHNNAAGRRAVSDSLTTACKCHGVSGSCSIKTCWKSLPDLLTIGSTIQKRYAIAVEVSRKRRGGKPVFVPVNRNKLAFREDELIYYTKSPDYCLPDKSAGSYGTVHRQCKKGVDGSGGCQSMCCGRGYTTQTMQIKHRCACKYYWCCYVKCKTCSKTIEINRCV